MQLADITLKTIIIHLCLQKKFIYIITIIIIIIIIIIIT